MTTVWDALAGTPPTGDMLAAKAFAPHIFADLYAAVDRGGDRRLLVQLSPDDFSTVTDRGSRGLLVTTSALAVAGQSERRYIEILCRDRAGHSMLNLLGAELAEELANDTKPAALVVDRVVAKWRRFWSQYPQALMSVEQQLGLFGELWFLRYCLMSAIGPAAAVPIWRGPFGARHDFESAAGSFEIKTARGASVMINSLEQLERPSSGEFHLFCLSVRDERGAANSLPSLVSVCKEACEGDVVASDGLDRALSAYGYSDVFKSEYEALKLRVLKEELYLVDERFPRIVTESFKNEIPSNISDIRYLLNLAGLDRFVVARTSSNIAQLLRKSSAWQIS